MVIYLASDHRGFALKEQLKSWLEGQGDRVKDFGNSVFDEDDDYPDFSQPLARELNKYPLNRGIVFCGSGIGVDIVANRFERVRCGLGFTLRQVVHGRSFDNINCLSLPADFIDFSQAKELTKAFLKTEFSGQKRYRQRLEKIDRIRSDEKA
jgi:ribose 5-phosphate isomerase B